MIEFPGVINDGKDLVDQIKQDPTAIVTDPTFGDQVEDFIDEVADIGEEVWDAMPDWPFGNDDEEVADNTPVPGDEEDNPDEQPPDDEGFNEKGRKIVTFSDGKPAVDKIVWNILGGGGTGQRIQFPEGGYLERDLADGKIHICTESIKAQPPTKAETCVAGSEMVLDGTADLRRLVTGSGFNPFSAKNPTEWLNESVTMFHESLRIAADKVPAEAGGPGSIESDPKPNTRNGNVFNFEVVQQILGSPEASSLSAYRSAYLAELRTQGKDFSVEGFRAWLLSANGQDFKGVELAFRLNATGTEVVGLECEATTMFNQFKAVGIVPADMDRLEFELRFTHLHDGYLKTVQELAKTDEAYKKYANAIAMRTPGSMIEFTSGLRFKNGSKSVPPNEKVTNAGVRDILANIVNNNDWATLTGAAKKTFKSVVVTDPKSSLKAGQTIYYHPGGHARIISGFEAGKGFKADDSYFGFNYACDKVDEEGVCHGVNYETDIDGSMYALVGR